MNENTVLIFKPTVRYFNHDKTYLGVLAGARLVTYKLPDKLEFDFSRVINGVGKEEIPDKVANHLVEWGLCEWTKHKSQKDLQEYKFLFESQEGYDAAVKKVANSEIHIVNLISLESLNKSEIKFKVSDQWEKIEAKKDDLLVVISKDIYDDRLKLINQKFYQQKRDWLLLCLDSPFMQIGPFFRFSESGGCFNCFFSRFNSKIPFSISKENQRRESHSSVFEALAISQIIRFFLTSTQGLESALFFFNGLTLDGEQKPFVYYPECELCHAK